MQFYVGVTDNKWFDFLAARRPDEVNFWRPRSTQNFRAIPPGAPFLFKLHAPQNYIAGGGFFVRHSILPLSLAWQCFGLNNGAEDIDQVRRLIQNLRGDSNPNPYIGCTVLTSPFFFPKEQWIPVPENWSRNIVTGKTYDTAEAAGARLWRQVEERLHEQPTIQDERLVAESPETSGEQPLYLTRGRLGQGAFRVLVTDAYARKCAVTGERTLPVLEAAHIKPFSESGPNKVSNGLLLRSDLHILFDNGYMTVTPDYHVEVSRRIHDDFDNGKEYYRLHGKRLEALPQQQFEQPDRKFIEWHNEYQYAG